MKLYHYYRSSAAYRVRIALNFKGIPWQTALVDLRAPANAQHTPQFRALNPQRGEPPMLIPQAKYFTVRVPFEPTDLEAAQKSMTCHGSQFTPEALQRVMPVMRQAWNGMIAFIPGPSAKSGTDLFQ